MIRLAFHTGFLLGYPATEAVRMIRDAGYDEVELNAETHPWTNPHIDAYTPAGIIAELARLGPYSSICVHHDDFGSRHQDRRDVALEWTEKMMDRAVDLGVNLVHVIPGGDADYDALISSLSAAAETAEKRRITLALEPIVNRMIGTAERARAVVDAVPELKINFDPSHMHVMGDNIREAADTLSPYVAHVHLKDARGTPGDWAFVALGEGEIDLRGMMQVLVGNGYRGVVSIEHESHIFAGDKRSPAEVLPQCRRYFDEIMKGIKINA
jgi:sugar phosphate isomerase/epimerase